MFTRTNYFQVSGTFDEKAYQEELKKFAEEYEQKATLFADPNYAGHMNWDISKPHTDALKMAIDYNQNIVAEESSPLAAELEKRFVREFAKDMGYDDDSWGYISSGGTISNLVALWVARNKQMAKHKKAKYVLVAEDHHYSVEKACNILGLQIADLKIDENIPPNQVAAVICIAGSTENGRTDDIVYWRKFCDQHDIHLHVDAAYGGYYVYCLDSPDDLLTPWEKTQLRAMREADSITIDPHKLGYAPYTAGLFLLKNKNDVMYINSKDDVKYLGVMTTSLYTVEGSRSGAVAASLYFGHKQLKPHYKEILESNLIGAKELKIRISASEDFRLLQKVDDKGNVIDLCGLGEVCFTTKNQQYPMNYLMKCFCDPGNIRKGKIQLVSTNIEGVDYFRICVMNPALGRNINDWWKRFEEQLNEYKANFEDYVKQKTANIRAIEQECIQPGELEKLIRSGKKIVAYNGFEPRGLISLPLAVLTVLNANVLMENDCHVKLFLADWYAKLNRKFNGNLEKIQTVGKYYIEVFIGLGINRKDLEFVWASDIMFKDQYWERVIDIATKINEKRAEKATQIMMRNEKEKIYVSQLLYPCMQVADAFELNVDISQMGMDQLKCNVLLIEYAGMEKLQTPVIISHHVVMGLAGVGEDGRNKKANDPDSVIYMSDSSEQVKHKINKAYCTDETAGNPIFEYIKYILLPWFKELEFEGQKFTSIAGIQSAFAQFNKKLLKEKVSEYINEILDIVRNHFATGERKKLFDKAMEYCNGKETFLPSLSMEELKKVNE